MRRPTKPLLLASLTAAAAAMPGAAQEFPPSCVMCQATYVPAAEIQRFLTIPQVDQQVRSLDIGKANVQVAIAHRERLEEPGAVAEHSLVTEIYYVLSGGGTNVLGPELVDAVPRPPTNNAVQRLNGPGHNAAAIRNGRTVELRPGDVLVIPAGTGHQFTRIDDHITYLMIRVDPDKVVPLMDEDDARRYLEEQARD
ncbi:MAG: AraC family ligand binding domain-containing protein [Gemmatimonadales bacterium]